MSTKNVPSHDLLDSFTTFGAFLRFLRRRARLTQRELSIAVGYSEAHISLLESGRRLPDLATLAALFVPALALQAEPELTARMLQLAAAARSSGSVTVTHTMRRQVIAAEEIVEEFPEASTSTFKLPRRSPDLRAPLLPLLGRASEVAALRARLLDPGVRLLTLVGPPGVGKTRLALELAWTLDGEFPDGARFVELAPLVDGAALPGTLIQTLGLPAPAGAQSERECLQAGLRERRLLLVLDNFEQLRAAAAQVANLLTTAPGLKILVTSRVALGLYGEHEWPLAPLPLPDLVPLAPPDELARNPSVALFVARAGAVLPGFALSEANALPTAVTCVRLDGLPLALELAAAQMKRFSPIELVAHLLGEQNGAPALRLLARVSPNVDARHQTLRDAIDWSFKLLLPEEQVLFARLGIFAGGFTPAATESVCSFEDEGARPQDGNFLSSDVHRLLGGLVEKNLVRPAAGGEPRYLLLETLRAFALEQLSARGDLEIAQHRHADYFARWLESADARFDPPADLQWGVRVRAEGANLRAALAWCEGHAAELGLRLAARLWVFWNAAGQFGEGRTWLEALLALTALPSDTRALALLGLGVLRARQWQYAEARAALLESHALYQALGDELGVATATGWLGQVAAYERRYDEAQALAEDALARFHALGDKRGESFALGSLMGNAKDRGDYASAQRLFEAHLRLAREDGFARHLGWQLATGANLARLQHDHARAREMLDEALAHFEAVDDRPGIAYTLGLLGYQARLSEDYAGALEQLSEALHCARDSRQYVPVTLCYLGIVAIAQGDNARGVRLCARAFALRPDLRLALDVDEEADLDASLAGAREALGAAAFDAEWTRGGDNSEHQVMADAVA